MNPVDPLLIIAILIVAGVIMYGVILICWMLKQIRVALEATTASFERISATLDRMHDFTVAQDERDAVLRAREKSW